MIQIPCTIIRCAVSSTAAAPGAACDEEPEQHEEEREDEREHEIGGDAGRGDQDVAPHEVAVLPRVDRNRLGAAEGERALGAELEQRRQEEAHPGIDVRHRVQRDAPEQVGGVVALAERGGGVGVLVRGHGEHEHGKREDELAELGVQGGSFSAGRPKVTCGAGSSQSSVALDLAWGLP